MVGFRLREFFADFFNHFQCVFAFAVICLLEAFSDRDIRFRLLQGIKKLL